jgi:hypothetical protein
MHNPLGEGRTERHARRRSLQVSRWLLNRAAIGSWESAAPCMQCRYTVVDPAMRAIIGVAYRPLRQKVRGIGAQCVAKYA